MKLQHISSLLLTFNTLGSNALATKGKTLKARQEENPAYKAYTIDQPIDHFPNSTRYEPHTTSTFKQRYFFDDKYYKPGGPVLLYIGGETSGENRFDNLESGIIKILMEATNGLGVILENRYYGESYPYNSSTTDELRFLTTEQTIADNAYFAQHAAFPGLNATSSLTAPETPWILYGGSLAGAQTAFSIKTYPEILWGGIASSGTTKAKLDAVEWYDPIQKYAPQDCVGTLNALIPKIDNLFTHGSPSEIHTLKQLFGLESLTDNRDFAQTIAFPLGGPMNYPTNTWQELNWNPAYGSQDFWFFCQNITNPDSSPNITALDSVFAANSTQGEKKWEGLGNYANYIKNYVRPLCPSGEYASTACFGTQNETYWADPTSSSTRSYLYSACTEQGAYIAARQNTSYPSLISRVLKTEYTQQWCNWAFPPGSHNSIPQTPELERYNVYGGYNVSADRLAHVDGEQDVWLSLCYHSKDLENGVRYTRSMEEAYARPQLLITGAGHHWDSYGVADGEEGVEVPQFVREAQRWEVRVVKRWVRDFWKGKEGKKKKKGEGREEL